MLTKHYPKNFKEIPSPCYVLEEEKFIKNLEILDSIQKQSGAKILLALKGYALWRSFEIAKKYLSGVTASGLHEAKLGYETFGGEITTFSPSYKKEEMQELVKISNHIIFNSFVQWQTFKPMIDEANKMRENKIEVGLRVNPLYSEVTPEIYNPCIEGSRLGIPPKEFKKGVKKYGLEGISGLHFHTHCEQNSDALKRTLKHFINILEIISRKCNGLILVEDIILHGKIMIENFWLRLLKTLRINSIQKFIWSRVKQ